MNSKLISKLYHNKYLKFSWKQKILKLSYYTPFQLDELSLLQLLNYQLPNKCYTFTLMLTHSLLKKLQCIFQTSMISMLYFHSNTVVLRREIIIKVTGYQKKNIPKSAKYLHYIAWVLEAHWAVKPTRELWSRSTSCM